MSLQDLIPTSNPFLNLRARSVALSVVAALSIGLTSTAAGAQNKESLFQEANSALRAAESARANFFAPRSYALAMKYYRNAERKFDSSRSADAIRNALALATRELQKAAAASKAVQTKLASVLKTRADAEKVRAPSHASGLWKRAEQKLSRAIRDLERGAHDFAKKSGDEAEQLYRDAELTTIKSTYLNEARLTLAQARQNKVGRYAPKTFKRAQNLLAKAESSLNKNRYDTDLPRSLAQQAQYEVKHAIYLAKVIKSARTNRSTTEDIILDWETPLHQVAAAADMTATFDGGYKKPAKKIVAYIEKQRDDSQRLQQDKAGLQTEVEQLNRALQDVSQERTGLARRFEVQTERREKLENEVSGLRTEVDQLQRNLGGASEERVALSAHLESQARIRKNLEQEIDTLKREIDVLEQMVKTVSEERTLISKSLEAQSRRRKQAEKIESMFSRGEARILRQADDIIIRLVGLSFAVGRSTIEPKNFGLLAKVGRALQGFPKSRLTIEGHTDSYGSDAKNLALSQKRAEAVKKYLLANLKTKPSKIEAVGYGETKPVANNETKEGRAKNRRIDVVIGPKVGAN